jgi:hypothetical protein
MNGFAEMDADLAIRSANWTKLEKLTTAASLRRAADQLEQSAAIMTEADDLLASARDLQLPPESGQVWN